MPKRQSSPSEVAASPQTEPTPGLFDARPDPEAQPEDDSPTVRTVAYTPAARADGPAGDGDADSPTVTVPAVAAATADDEPATEVLPTMPVDVALEDTAPVGTALADTAPVGTAPGDTAPGDTAPGDTAPADTALVDTALVDTPTGDTGPGDPPTVDPGAADDAEGEQPPARRRKRLLLIAAGVVGLLAALYGGDLALGSGSVPRGVTVSGVPIGGLALADAERTLRTEIEPRTLRPIAVTAGEASSEIDPTVAGLSVDWKGTLARAGEQPLNPITRITSFFTQREIGITTATDPEALDAALAALPPIVDRPAAEGSVRFDGITPVAVDPVPGQQLDVAAAADVLKRDWATGSPVVLPMTVLPPITTADDVATAIEKTARPAVSAPVVVNGEGGTKGTLTPEVIATLLSFRADPGGLVPEVNIKAATDALEPGLARSETPGRNASLDFSSGRPVVTPSKDGRGVDFDVTLKDLLTVLSGTGERTITAVYADQPAELTTEKLNSLGITGVIGEFTTHNFAPDSGRNIKRAAEVINGTIVQPGETFSLNGATDPRDAAHGYVEAGIINDGHASRGVGGGVSQIATTTYNAAYFAGMVDVAHKEHSFFISRYPPGREATVFGSAIDLKFRNDNPTGVMIQTVWTPNSITVRLYGTKRYEVTSTPGPRTKPTKPTKVTIPKGQPCSPSLGAPGFTITDTRTLREISTGKVRNETRTVKYNPSPIVECGDGGGEKKKDDDDD